jgi:hypothetical protein
MGFSTDDEDYILIAGPIGTATEVFHIPMQSNQEGRRRLDARRIQRLHWPGPTMTLQLKGPQKISIHFSR